GADYSDALQESSTSEWRRLRIGHLGGSSESWREQREEQRLMQRSLRGHYPDQVPRSVAIPPSQPGSPSSRCGILRLSVVSLPARSHGRQLVPLGLVASRVERPNQGRSLWTDTYPDAIIDGDKRNAGV